MELVVEAQVLGDLAQRDGGVGQIFDGAGDLQVLNIMGDRLTGHLLEKLAQIVRTQRNIAAEFLQGNAGIQMRLDIFLQLGHDAVCPHMAGGLAVEVQLLQQQREKRMDIADDGFRRAGSRRALLRQNLSDDEIAGDMQIRTPDLAAPAVGIERIAGTDDFARDADPQHICAMLRRCAPLQPVQLLTGDDAELIL